MVYMATASTGAKTGCIFCDLPEEGKDREVLILHRGTLAFTILNRFPYTSGHLMIAPFRHVARLTELTAEERTEMIETLTFAEEGLTNAFHPQGFNVGVNIGDVAGAGYPGHVHFHIVPRWRGDTNFMPVLGGTKVVGEYLEETYDKLHEHWRT